MYKRGSISLILLLVFSILQAHHMTPHRHDIPKAHSHGHQGNHHHDEDERPSSPLDKADHSGEFGKALIKPGNGKYELTQLKFIPSLKPAFQTELVGLFQIIQKVSPTLPDYLIPPDPSLVGIKLRGPPSYM